MNTSKRNALFGILLLLITAIILPFLCSIRLNSVFIEGEYINLPVIMYHAVNTDKRRSGKYVITPTDFESDLKYLQKSGYTTISSKELIQYVYSGASLPEKPIMLTFDDGMYNNYKYILPILEKYNAHAIFSIVGEYTDEYTKNNVVNVNYSYLRWCDIDKASYSDYIEFGNHSYGFHSISSRRFGSKKNKNEVLYDYIMTFAKDTQKMQSEFYSNCKYRPAIYTYPYGAYTKETTKVLKKMGFLVTFSCEDGINTISRNKECLFLLKRINRPGNMSSTAFFSKEKL